MKYELVVPIYVVLHFGVSQELLIQVDINVLLKASRPPT